MTMKNIKTVVGILGLIAFVGATFAHVAHASDTSAAPQTQIEQQIQGGGDADQAQPLTVGKGVSVAPDEVAKKSLYCTYQYQYVCNAYGYCYYTYVYVCF
jgi:hypothetical protein